MRRVLLSGILCAGVATAVLPAHAQVFRFTTPPPQISAASAEWQIKGAPITLGGLTYVPSGPAVFFDQWVMVRTATYRGIPVYVDATLEPYSIVYVPIGRGLMRPYERRREGELAGTVGSRTPSFPVQPEGEARLGDETSADEPLIFAPMMLPAEIEPRRERANASAPRAESTRDSLSNTTASPTNAATAVESIPRPSVTRGLWILYRGERWYHSGRAVLFDRTRFTRIDEYHGFPVYRDTAGARDDIFIPSTEGGPLTRYVH